jgi:uncharacterized protein YcaQ
MLLGAQGLLEPPVRPATKADVLASIQRMGVLQIDTIHVVARSPYLVLWSRLGSYEPVWLEELLAEGAIFEAWSHCACFAPTEDYRLYRRGMLEEHPRSHEWIADHPETVDAVLRRVAEMGEVRSAHFERTDGKSGGWWEWKPEKAALEALFATGRLAIARRENFQRIYALTERVMPWWNEADAASVDEVAREFALRTVRSLGVTTAAWVPDYYRTAKRGIADRLDALVDEGALLHVEVEGWPVAGYMHPNNLPLLAAIRSGARRPAVTTLLSPFDPIVWDRARALALFGFDYRIEVYTPAPKRRYGYFSLPILHQDELIGRLDAKAHRSDGVFEVRSLHLEPDIDTTDELVMALAQTLRDCATWHRTPEVRIAASNPAAIGEAVREALTQETPQLRIPRMKG